MHHVLERFAFCSLLGIISAIVHCLDAAGVSFGMPTLAPRFSAIAAMHRVLAKTQRDAPLSVRWVIFIACRLAQSLHDAISDLAVDLAQPFCFVVWNQLCLLAHGAHRALLHRTVGAVNMQHSSAVLFATAKGAYDMSLKISSFYAFVV